ncbi:uncharacterized protein VICG_02071 [Vittaforma corneae ATCC 50505]|uniref:Uncharacterized protein n=1 Tax=Vittaforma corneae (strain ATCC 50505) TaxID=993615 RepID=L2GJ48_VITCO|nr:uncharacterized protein VICG_02071 [Vittaforma corneae ATCC 50505]ELA40891.1 hypothetical protein VICG_02071 [Vittaforma corneae ATCC 50505]
MSKPFPIGSFYNVLFYSIISTVAIFLLIFLILIYKYDLLSDFTVMPFEISNETFVFIPYKGDYGKMNHLFKKIQKDYSSIASGNARMCTVYYDHTSKKENAGRAVIGVLAKRDDNANEQIVSKMNRLGYTDTFQFERLKVVGTAFPLYSFLNILFGLFRGLPMVQKYLKENKKKDHGSKASLNVSDDYPIIHIYDYCLHKYIIAVPLKDSMIPQFDKLYESHKDK